MRKLLVVVINPRKKKGGIAKERPCTALRVVFKKRDFQQLLATEASHPNSITATMALLVDKHRPRSLDQLTYHKDLSERLRSLVIPPLPSPFNPNPT